MPVEAAPRKSALAAAILLGVREQCADLLRDALDLRRRPPAIPRCSVASCANTVSMAARSGAALARSAATAANTRLFNSPKSRDCACADQLREHRIAPLGAHEIQQMRQLLLQQVRATRAARCAAAAPRARARASRSAICARSSAARGNGAVSLARLAQEAARSVDVAALDRESREFAQIMCGHRCAAAPP